MDLNDVSGKYAWIANGEFQGTASGLGIINIPVVTPADNDGVKNIATFVGSVTYGGAVVDTIELRVDYNTPPSPAVPYYKVTFVRTTSGGAKVLGNGFFAKADFGLSIVGSEISIAEINSGRLTTAVNKFIWAKLP